ncbi:MAG: hypothetical protein IT359_04405 [Gemmatimonadaceae bacterium]|nr:hypothetical protein [Gemmatimonadaceae bacterium]
MRWTVRLVRVAVLAIMVANLSSCFLFCALSPTACKAPPSSQQIVAPVVSVSASPARLDVVAGSTTTSSLSISLAGGPSGAALSLGGSLPGGVTASFVPATVSGNGTSMLTLSAAANAAPGLFQFDVVATSTGSATATVGTTPITGEVLRPFRLSGVNAQTMTVGTSRDIAVAVARATGFTAPVTFSVDPATLPAGSTVTFAPSSTTSNTSTLSLAVPQGASTGQYLVRLYATSGGSADTARFLLDVQAAPVPPDFSIVATPAQVDVAPGGSGLVTLSITVSQVGLGPVVLSAGALPPGTTASFAPPSLTSGNAQLTIATSAATPDGLYPIVVTGTAGSLVRQVTVTLGVTTPADFQLAVTPASVTVPAGGNAQAAVAIQRTGNPGAVTLDVTGLPAGVTATANPASVTGSTSTLTVAVGASVAAGSYPLVVRGVAGSITRTVPLTLVVPAAPAPLVTIQLLTPNVSIAPGGTALVPVRLTRTGSAIGRFLELRVAGLPAGGNAWVTPSFTYGDTATLHVIGGVPGNYPVAVTVVLGAVLPTATASVTVTSSSTPDFSLIPSPTTLTITRGMFTPISLSIIRSNGFAGAVTLAGIPDDVSNYAVNFTPAQTTGNSAAIAVYASPLVTAGVHILRLRGTSGSITRTVSVTLLVQ